MLLLSPQALAHTYSPPMVRDSWEHVQLYRQTQRYPDDWGATRVANAINGDDEQPWEGLSRGNLRVWVDGDGMPDAGRAVNVATGNGWLANEWTPTVRALAGLVAGIFACGSIAQETWVPTWAPDSTVGEQITQSALETVGVGFNRLDRPENSGGRKRADELRPKKHGSILGRTLHATGAPTGDKNTESVVGLPEWLSDAPPDIRASFAERLVRERGSKRVQKATLVIQSERPRQYFEDVRALLEDVTGESVTASDAGVTISADAVRTLGLT